MSETRDLDIDRARVLLNSARVSRWTIVDFNRRQSVAEHSYLVTVIGLLLYDQCIVQHSTPERTAFAAYLLEHDAEESLLGDMPTNVKSALARQAPGALHQVKATLGAFVPRHSNSFTVASAAGLLCKAADLIEAVRFVHINRNGLNNHHNAVMKTLFEQLHSLHRSGQIEWPHAINWDRFGELKEALLLDA